MSLSESSVSEWEKILAAAYPHGRAHEICREWREQSAALAKLSPGEKCEGCGLHGPGVEFTRIRVTNGVLCLCKTCLEDVNRKNPQLAAKDRRIAELEQIAQARFETMTELTNANCDLHAWADRVQEAAKPYIEYADLCDDVDKAMEKAGWKHEDTPQNQERQLIAGCGRTLRTVLNERPKS